MYLVTQSGTRSVNLDLCLGFKMRNDKKYDGDTGVHWYVDAIMGPGKDNEICLFASNTKEGARTFHKFLLSRLLKSGTGVCFVNDIIEGKSIGTDLKSIMEIDNY